MPTRTYPQALAMLTALEQEIDLSVNDKLSFFAFELMEDLKKQIEPIQLQLEKEQRRLALKYAEVDANGILLSNGGFVKVGRKSINFQISAENQINMSDELSAFISAFETTEIAVPEIICPDCPRIGNLSEEFKTQFDGVLIDNSIINE